MKTKILFTLIIAGSTTHCIANTRLTLSPALLYFDYSEYNTDDALLDRELGWLPGLEVNLTQTLAQDWSIGVTGQYYQGIVDYTGKTQAGTPHSTQTDTALLRLGARVEKTVYTRTSLFIAALAHQWRRDIRNNNGINGILETYRWAEYSIGLNYDYPIDQDNALNIEAAYLITRNATIDVDLSRVDLGSAVLDIGNGNGGKLNASWSTRYTETTRFGLTLFFEAWNFARSNTKPTDGGSSSVRVTEPRSITSNTGIKFNIEYNF